ncbi:MAG: GAF domain-containing SpoIIE family protein phosphatase [Rhodothermales bacterium]
MLFASRQAVQALETRLRAAEEENRGLHRAVEELSLLNTLAREIGASHDLQQITKRIVHQALHAVEAEQGVLAVLDAQPEGESLRTLVRTAAGTSARPALRADDHLLGWMQLHHRPLRLDAPRTDPRFAATPWPDDVASVLSVPLSAQSRLIGALTVFNKRGGGGFSAEDERLLAILAGQSAQVIENARLLEEEKELVRMQEALHLARRIQRGLLPERPPDVPGYDLAGLSLPADTVGGDYFDFIPVGDGRLALCVGDVVGKGLPASLLMANVQATLRGQTGQDIGAAECLGRANRFLKRTLRPGTFVTLVYGILDAGTHEFHSANAGHNRPLLLRADGTLERLEHGGLVLGALSDSLYEEVGHVLYPDDLLLLYSDGLTEAMSDAREEFGEERVGALLRSHRTHSAKAVVDALVEAVQAHAGATPQSDDITLLVVKRAGAGG